MTVAIVAVASVAAILGGFVVLLWPVEGMLRRPVAAPSGASRQFRRPVASLLPTDRLELGWGDTPLGNLAE